MYQYSDNVVITEGPEKMDGKVLKFTPNTVDVTYNCHAIYTLRKASWDSLWYNANFLDDKYYVISFDYMTEGTSVGEFYFKNRQAQTYNLPLGADADGIVRNFNLVLKGSDIGTGIYLWAFFKNGGGCVYVDNFSVTSFEEIPEISCIEDYSFVSAAEFNFDAKGFLFNAKIDGSEVEVQYDDENKKLIIPVSEIQKLAVGEHEIEIDAGIMSISCKFNVIDSRVSVLNETQKDVIFGDGAEVKLAGEFDTTLTVVALNRLGTADWDNTTGKFTAVHSDGAMNVGYVTIESDGLKLSRELVDQCYHSVGYTVTFDNGKSVEFTLNSNQTFFTNWDETYVWREGSAGANNESCQNHSVASITSDENGGKYMLYTPTNSTNTLHGILTHRYKVDGVARAPSNSLWTVTVDNTEKIAISFDYEIIGGNNSKFSFAYRKNGENSGWHYINLDPEENRFYVEMPVAELKITMVTIAGSRTAGESLKIDNYSIAQIKLPEVKSDVSYAKESGGDLVMSFNPNNLEYTLILNGEEVESVYNAEDGTLTISEDIISKLEAGTYTIRFNLLFSYKEITLTIS